MTGLNFRWQEPREGKKGDSLFKNGFRAVIFILISRRGSL